MRQVDHETLRLRGRQLVVPDERVLLVHRPRRTVDIVADMNPCTGGGGAVSFLRTAVGCTYRDSYDVSLAVIVF